MKTYIKSYPLLKQAYDSSNQSALITALKENQYEFYALLVCILQQELFDGSNQEG